MNKEIIIDRVDVSGCIHRATNKIGNDIGTYCRCFTESCKNIKNCHYKQLKRAEQECERLKKDVERWKSNFNGKVSAIEELLQQLDQLKVENEKLKQYKGSKQASYETMQVQWNEAKNEVKKLKAENEQLTKNYFTVIQQRNVAEQQLDKLKEENEELKKLLPILQRFVETGEISEVKK